jgi:hypothetical protein
MLHFINHESWSDHLSFLLFIRSTLRTTCAKLILQIESLYDNIEAGHVDANNNVVDPQDYHKVIYIYNKYYYRIRIRMRIIFL